MAYINVTPQKLEQTADVINGYVDTHKKKMNEASSAMSKLGTTWEGEDFKATQQKWSEITADDSTISQAATSLQNYADYLRFAAQQYKSAQQKAVDRAYRLPTL